MRKPWLAASLLAAMGCAAPIERVEAPLTSMTVRQARAALLESLQQLSHIASPREMTLTRRRLTFTGTLTVEEYAPRPAPCELTFADVGEMAVQSLFHGWHDVLSDGKRIVLDTTPQGGWGGAFKTKTAAVKFAQALIVLRDAARAPDPEEADFAAFSSCAKDWLASPSRPAMSEEARIQQAVAEEAFKRKDFSAALNAYSAALEKHPLWPEGQYNAALLAAEIGDVEAAAAHMRRYLALAPDAKDAEDAQKKYLLWRHRAGN